MEERNQPPPSGNVANNIQNVGVVKVSHGMPNPNNPAAQRGTLIQLRVLMNRDKPGGHWIFTRDFIGHPVPRKISVTVDANAIGLWFTSSHAVAGAGIPPVPLGAGGTAYAYPNEFGSTAGAIGLGQDGFGAGQDYWFFTVPPPPQPGAPPPVYSFTITFSASGGSVQIPNVHT